MKEKEIVVNGKSFKIHELLAIEFDGISDLEKSSDRVKEVVKKSADLTEEDYSKLTVRERKELMDIINEVNGWAEDFQKSEIEEKKK